MIPTIISIPYDVAPITMTMFCPFESGLSSGAIDPAQRPDRDPSIELGSWPRDLGISPCLHGDLEGSWGVSLFLGCGMGWSMGRSNWRTREAPRTMSQIPIGWLMNRGV